MEEDRANKKVYLTTNKKETEEKKFKNFEDFINYMKQLDQKQFDKKDYKLFYDNISKDLEEYKRQYISVTTKEERKNLFELIRERENILDTCIIQTEDKEEINYINKIKQLYDDFINSIGKYTELIERQEKKEYKTFILFSKLTDNQVKYLYNELNNNIISCDEETFKKVFGEKSVLTEPLKNPIIFLKNVGDCYLLLNELKEHEYIITKGQLPNLEYFNIFYKDGIITQKRYNDARDKQTDKHITSIIYSLSLHK